jgi:dimethylglycine dehydrogenase
MRAGGADVVLLEKAELTSGSTWHAAGQITHSTSSFRLGKCVDYNIGLYSGALEAETGQAVTWHGCGSFRLAYTEDEMDWLRHTLSVGRALGFNIELVGPERVRRCIRSTISTASRRAAYARRRPCRPDQRHHGAGRRRAARARGSSAAAAPPTSRKAERRMGGRHRKGHIVCEHVVNAGGTYARQMGEWSGLQLPMTSMTHHYFVTDEVPEFRDLDRNCRSSAMTRRSPATSGWSRRRA